MRIEANRREGYDLLHAGSIALAQVEANGIRIDVKRLEETKRSIAVTIRDQRKELEESKVWKIWRRRFGERSNLTSRDQLATVLYQEMGHEVIDLTEGGKPAVDEEALQKIDHPFVVGLVKMLKYEKALGTFLRGIEKEVVGDRLHPVFNLHTARTFRSSSDSPNFQNFPVRDKEISRIIRSHFIPSKGSVLVENDFKGIEVCVSACYHRDPNFIDYITSPGRDMHRDMAAQIYCLDPSQVSKDARYGAKNKFVFPEFYGDFYISCARSLWDWIEKGELKGPEGESLFEHLRSHGIRERGECDPAHDPRRGTFELHLKKIEDDFWNRRFMEYGEWRKKWYRRYLDRGYFDLLTGFRIYGSYNRNAVVNYPIQGSAFHCLLWSLVRINHLLRKYQMKSLIVGQIHDSLIGDVRIDELRDYLAIVEKVTTVDLLRWYRWLIIPLQIEYEIAPSWGSWADKKEIRYTKGRFYHPDHPERSTNDVSKFMRVLDNRRNQ